MTKPILALLGTSLRSWFSAKGFWLVAAAALLPLILTGSWVATHRADAEMVEMTFDESKLLGGEPAQFTALVRNVGPIDIKEMNVTFAVGSVNPTTFTLIPVFETTETIGDLAPGQTREVPFTWDTATAGFYVAVAVADREDTVGEVEEYNNQWDVPIIVRQPIPNGTNAPPAPEGLIGDVNATTEVDLVVTDITPTGVSFAPSDEQTFTATIENRGATDVTDAAVQMEVGQAAFFFPQAQSVRNVTIPAGGSATATLTWTTQQGAYYVRAYVTPPPDTKDANPEDNDLAKGFSVDARLPDTITHPKPIEKQTIKEFYLQILSLLHLRILLPLVALFYAAGVVADEKERGSLAYVLTRPLPRWLLPITKFLGSFVVAALATILGLLLTYALLFGTTPNAASMGFLATPVLASLLALFVYGALFTLLGVVVQRPYLVGIAFILGWENAAAIFVSWVRNLTITQHIGNALVGWPLDKGLQWLPDPTIEGAEGSLRAFYILVIAGVALLVAASVAMKRREFEV